MVHTDEDLPFLKWNLSRSSHFVHIENLLLFLIEFWLELSIFYSLKT